MDKEIAKKVIGNRNFEFHNISDDHNWRDGMDWQQYHEEAAPITLSAIAW